MVVDVTGTLSSRRPSKPEMNGGTFGGFGDGRCVSGDRGCGTALPFIILSVVPSYPLWRFTSNELVHRFLTAGALFRYHPRISRSLIHYRSDSLSSGIGMLWRKAAVG